MNKAKIEQAGQNAAYIAAIGVATPEYTINQHQAVDFLLRLYGESLNSRTRRIAKKIFAHPSISQRGLAIEKLESLVEENPDQRVARFTHQAVELAAEAVGNALAQTPFTLDQITVLVVNTCTGYICPGLSSYLIQRLGLSGQVLAYDLVGSGCGGAIPNMQLAESLLRTHGGGVALSVAVEICSATFQMDDDLSLIVSNAIFADGASAAIIVSYPGEWQLLSFANRTAPMHREAVRYVYKNGQLHNQLDEYLPELVKEAVTQVVSDVLAAAELNFEDVRFWALHPGGERIINAVKLGLSLTEEQVGPTRKVLSEYGNMSSPTVLFVLREILKETVAKGDYCMMVTFGAGLSAYALLLRKC